MKKSSNNLNFINYQPSSDIVLLPEHGGPILCMDIKNNVIITGSTDHGLRVYALSNGKQVKELYAKKYGHTEWVTSVVILLDNRVVSGGNDSCVCVWDAKGIKCKTMMEHQGSISKLKCDDNFMLLSASYDSTVRIYNLVADPSCVGILKGNSNPSPIIQFEWVNSLCVTGSRDGLISLWDINTETCIFKQKLHEGHVSNINFHSDGFDSNLIVTTGINDGLINIIDMRSNTKVFSEIIHNGAINFLSTNQSNQIITGSADKSIKIIDIRNNYECLGTMKATDSVFCGDILDNFIAVGCGDGSLLAYNLDTQECLYGYGCDDKGGVRNVKILQDKMRIVTSGDSGKGMQILF